jgi:hypothetical protein
MLKNSINFFIEEKNLNYCKCGPNIYYILMHVISSLEELIGFFFQEVLFFTSVFYFYLNCLF